MKIILTKTFKKLDNLNKQVNIAKKIIIISFNC